MMIRDDDSGVLRRGSAAAAAAAAAAGHPESPLNRTAEGPEKDLFNQCLGSN